MFTNASGKVSIGFTNITGTTACLWKLVNDSQGWDPWPETNSWYGVNTNLISRSLHNVLTNFLILRCVMMEKGPMYGNLKYKQLSYEQHSEWNRGWSGAVVPVILVKPIDTLPLAFVSILPPTNILTSLSTWEVLKIVAPFVYKIVLKSSTLFQQVSNWKLKKPYTSFGSSRH